MTTMTTIATATRVSNPQPDVVLPVPNPYPVPVVSTVVVNKTTPDQRLDVTLQSDTKGHVFVQRIGSHSPLRSSSSTSSQGMMMIVVGSQILAINGQAVYRASPASRLLQARQRLEITTLHPDHRPTADLEPYCYVTAAPTSKISPGVSFGAVCGEALVCIRKVLVDSSSSSSSSCCTTPLRSGHVVLAVNGQAVWKVQDANRLQLAAARQSRPLILYCVDMTAVRQAMIQHAVLSSSRPPSSRHAAVFVVGSDTYELRERHYRITVTAHAETLLLLPNDDSNGNSWKLFLNNNVPCSEEAKALALRINSDHETCAYTLNYLNQCLQQQVEQLQASVVSAAWKHLMLTTTTSSGCDAVFQDDNAPTVVVLTPSAPTARALGMEEYANADDDNNNNSIPEAQAVLLTSQFSTIDL